MQLHVVDESQQRALTLGMQVVGGVGDQTGAREPGHSASCGSPALSRGDLQHERRNRVRRVGGVA